MASDNVCIYGNIDRKGERRRLAMGVAGALAALAGLWLTPPGPARLWLFCPALLALLGFAQARQKT